MSLDEVLALPPSNPIRKAYEASLRKPATKAVGEKPAPKRASGERHEDALYYALDEAGYWDAGLPIDQASERRYALIPYFLRGFAWGLYTKPRRKFQSDAAFPGERLLVEVDGGAHAAGKAKQRTDTERRGLAAAAGWRVLALTPAQVHSGDAVRLVREALASKEAR